MRHASDKNLLDANLSTKIKQWWSHRVSVVGWICPPKLIMLKSQPLVLWMWPYLEFWQRSQNEAIRWIITWDLKGRINRESGEREKAECRMARRNQRQTLHVHLQTCVASGVCSLRNVQPQMCATSGVCSLRCVQPQEEPILQTPWLQTSRLCGSHLVLPELSSVLYCEGRPSPVQPASCGWWGQGCQVPG